MGVLGDMSNFLDSVRNLVQVLSGVLGPTPGMEPQQLPAPPRQPVVLEAVDYRPLLAAFLAVYAAGEVRVGMRMLSV